MKKFATPATICLLALVIFGLESNWLEAARKPGTQSRVPPPIHSDRHVAASGSADIDTFVLAEFDFEGQGAPDSQGWVSIDITEQTRFWHVDTFMVPTSGGDQAMWCGTRPAATGEVCHYGCLPGYGNNWTQILETPTAFAVEGDVTWSFNANWDTEPGWDFLYMEYLNQNDYWISVDQVDGVATDTTLSYIIAAEGLNGSVRLRFRFSSDRAYSDEDCEYDSNGAVQLDNIVVADTTGTLHFEDFEDEALDAQETDDGMWVATIEPAFGDHTGLLDASTLFLPTPDNESHVWGFTSNSPYTCTVSYNCYPLPCGPDTLSVVPGGGWDDDDPDFANEIWSPIIDWTHDIDQNPVDPAATKTLLQFRVYRQLDSYGGIVYGWRARSFPAGAVCLDPLWSDLRPRWGNQGDWYEATVDISEHVVPGADQLQVALGAYDWSAQLCYGIPECGGCLTVSPLFDDVRVIRCKPTATGVEDAPLFENVLEANYPNPFNPVTTIEYSIKERAHVSLKVYNVTGQLVRTLVNRVQTPGEIVPVRWDANNDRGQAVSSGVYFYRLVTKGFAQTKKMVVLR